MNPIATKVIEQNMKLEGESPVYINQDDIEEIKNRFDTYYERKIALAIICYAKAYAVDGKFKLSQGMFANWLGMNPRTIRKYLNTMATLEFLYQSENGDVNSWYQKYVVSELNTFEIGLPLINEGEFKLIDNDIEKLYEEIFLGNFSVTDDSNWFPIPGHNDWYYINVDGKVKVEERIINGRKFPAKIVRSYKSSSGKSYVSLYDPESKSQKKYCVDTLLASTQG